MLLVFGPNDTYFFDDGAGHFKYRAGPEFKEYMRTHPIHKINSACLGEDGAFFLNYTSPDLQAMNAYDDPKLHYPALRSWLFTENVPHARETVVTCMGKDGAFFAASSQGHRWRNIPDGLSDYYQKFTRPDLFIKSRVNSADLGTNGTFLGIGVDNVWFWDLGDEYPEFSKLIGQKGINDCKYVSISPFAPNQHIAVFNDNSVHWSLPPLWIQDMQSLMQELAVGAGASIPAAPRPPARPHTNTSSGSGRWKPSWRPGNSAPPQIPMPAPAPAASPVVTSPGGNSFDWNQAMGLTQSALDAYNNAQGQGQGQGSGQFTDAANNGLQLVNNLANNGLMVGQVVSQFGGAAAACCVM